MKLNPIFATSGSIATAIMLSSLLRTRTTSLHEEIERLLDWPRGVRDRDDYFLSLGHFFGIYEPLERSLAEFRARDAPFCAVALRRQ
jgi:hypothetical protein